MGGKGHKRDKSTQKFMEALLGVTLAAHATPSPTLPEEAKRAKDLYSSFVNKGKRVKAWKELDSLWKSKPCSTLCIAAAKMHLIATVEQVCKLEQAGAREDAALIGLLQALEFAFEGASKYMSIQCLVLAIFILHTSRGRGQIQQIKRRREITLQLNAQFDSMSESAAKWAKVKWVDPRLESYEKDRFPFEWEPYSSKNLKDWIEAVRDDWNKFVPVITRTDKLAEDMGGNPSSSCGGVDHAASVSELAREDLGVPADVRLAGSFALKLCDKESIRRHLDALEAKSKSSTAFDTLQAASNSVKSAPTPASTRAGRAATAAAAAAVVQLAAAAGMEDRAAGHGGGLSAVQPLPQPTPPSFTRSSQPESSVAIQHQGIGKLRERHRAEQKRQQAQRAQQRAAEVHQYLERSLKSNYSSQEAAQQLLADSCQMSIEDYKKALKAAVAAKELMQAEADLALANLKRLQGVNRASPCHVWYGDPHLDMGAKWHRVEGQEQMEELLCDRLQQDWVLAEEATQWVGGHLDGWKDLLLRMGLESNTMTDVDRDSMLAQEDPSVGETLVRVWAEDFPVPPPVVAGFEVDKDASEELEALLPAGARPCSCGRCQREVQQQQQPTADLDAMEMPYLYGAGKSSVKSKEHTGSESSKEEILPGRLLQGNGAAVAESTDSGLAAMNTNASGSQCFADTAPAGSSPSRVQLAQQQWREAMHSEEYGSVLQLDVYINEAERSQQYLDSILGRPEGLMQQCRVLAANPEGAPSNEADELVRRAVVGHLMLQLAGAWDTPKQSVGGLQCDAECSCVAGDSARCDSTEQTNPSLQLSLAQNRAQGGVVETLRLLRRAMDPTCNLETLIMDCSVSEQAGRAAVAKLGQLREAELAAEAAASKAWAELAAAMHAQECLGVARAEATTVSSKGLCCGGPAVGVDTASGMEGMREDDGAISRPVTFCTPLLTTVLEGVAGRGGQDSAAVGATSGPDWEQERSRLLVLKGQLARASLDGLGQIWRRRRLTDKMSFQLCQFIADSLATCGELSSHPAEREVLRRAAERLLVGPAPAPCVLRLAGWLPLRVLRHLYTFVVLLVGECFASPQDLSEEIEDLVYADASAGVLSPDGKDILVRPAVFAALTPVQCSGHQGLYGDVFNPEPGFGKKKAGRFEPVSLCTTGSGDGACPAPLTGSAAHASAGSENWLERVAAYVCAPSDTRQAQQDGPREEIVGDLHKLWHVEGVLLGLANLCEYWERGLDDSLARMETLRLTLDQIGSGASESCATSTPPKGTFQLEQQLLEARKVLQATEAVELSLRLAVIKMHGVCFEDVLHMLREQSADLKLENEASTAAAISKFQCMLRDSSAEGEACRTRMQELAAAPAPHLEGKELETTRALGLVLGASTNGKQQHSQQKIRALLAARPERWEATLQAGRELVLSTLRRLDECTEALATLGEWCYIKQCSLVGQLRSQYCTHSCGDEVVGVLLRLKATQNWIPAILAEQEQERRSKAEALEIELEDEKRREAHARAARKAQKARQKIHDAALNTSVSHLHERGTAVRSAVCSGKDGCSSCGSSEDEAGRDEARGRHGAAQAPTPEANGVSGDADWVADLLARQQPRAPPAQQPSPALAPRAGDHHGRAGKHQEHQPQPTARKPPPPREVMRVVSYLGDWLCACGSLNKLRSCCPCGQVGPCRDWVRGVCDFSHCRFPHPPFDLPATTSVKKAARVANPAPDAPVFKKTTSSAGPFRVQPKKAAPPSSSATTVPLPGHAHAQSAKTAALHTRVPGSSICSSSSSGSLQTDAQAHALGVIPPGAQHLDIPSQITAAAGVARSGSKAGPASFAAAVAGGRSGGSGSLGRAPRSAWGVPGILSPQPGPHPQECNCSASAATSGCTSPTPREGVEGSVSGSHSATPPHALLLGASPRGAAGASARTSMDAGGRDGGELVSSVPAQAAARLAASHSLPGFQPHTSWEHPCSSLLPAPFSEQQGQNRDVDDEEAYFSCFNSQVLQGLGLSEPNELESEPQPTAPAARSRPSSPASRREGEATASHRAGHAQGGSTTLLAAIVQCLWCCTEFREEMRSWPEPVYAAHPVVKALYSLFHALAKDHRGGGGSGTPAPGAAAEAVFPCLQLSSGEIQGPLDTLAGQLCHPGQAADAGAVLLAMYERVQEVAAMRGKPMLADIVFGLPVNEAAQCQGCQRITRQASYMQHMVTAQAVAIARLQASSMGGAASLGYMLRMLADQGQVHCEKRAGGCGGQCSTRRLLQGVPRVFTLQLQWDKSSKNEGLLPCVVEGLNEQVDLADVYQDLARHRYVFQLRSVVCSGQDSCCAFVRVPEQGEWLLLGDEGRCCVGTAWADVQAKCRQQHMQPSLLFFNAL